MARLAAAMDKVAAIDVCELSDDQLASRIRMLETSERRIAALKAAHLGELDPCNRRGSGRQVRAANQLQEKGRT